MKFSVDYTPKYQVQTCTDPYRYGFNGKERLDEFGHAGDVYDYGFRIYNSSLSRFLSVDPLARSYPWYIPYQFAGNKPIWAMDLDGREEIYYYPAQRKKYLGLDNAMKILELSGIMKELREVYATNNNLTDIYINVTPLEGPNATTTYFSNYDRSNEGKNLAMRDMRKRNPNMDLKPVMYFTLMRNQETVIVRLDEDLVKDAETDPEAAKALALILVHEIEAHGMDYKDGKNDRTEAEEHQWFYNDPNLTSYSPDYNDIKPNSPAGEYKKIIEETVAKMNQYKPQQKMQLPKGNIKKSSTKSAPSSKTSRSVRDFKTVPRK